MKFWLLLAAALFSVFLYFVADRVVFLIRSEHTVGEVVQIRPRNARCGSRRSKRPCTKFSADVRFTVAGAGYSETVSAGSARGYNVPTQYARYRIGSPVTMLVNPRDPEEAYRDTFMDVWSTPIMTLLFPIGAVVAGLRITGGRRPDESPYSPSGPLIT